MLKPINIIKIILLTSLFSLLTCSIHAEEQPVVKTVKIIGTSSVYKGNIENAKKNAISGCLSSAVNQVAAELLQDQSLVNNFRKISETLHIKSGEFVQNYKVLAEAESEKIYSVMIQATVSVDRLKEQFSDAEIAEEKKPVVMPKVLFFIAEQNIDNLTPQYWWGENTNPVESVAENAIVKIMADKGFQVIKHGNSLPDQSGEDSAVIYKPYLEGYEAVDIGVKLQADVVIVGNCVAEKSLNTMGDDIKSFTGTVKTRAFRTDTGEEIASSSQTSVKADADEAKGATEALTASGNLAAGELASQIAYVWNQVVKEAEMLTISVGGTNNLGNFVMFRKALTGMPGVKEIQIREMKSDEATIVVDYKKELRELADALMITSFESFGIHLLEISGKTMKIDLVPSFQSEE
ncbi:MAG: hypothetical protein GY749_49265 [Desulfobacteraceae bacterium]|nr:hypothetical protein [Desulfobacteraceae bacterium]